MTKKYGYIFIILLIILMFAIFLMDISPIKTNAEENNNFVMDIGTLTKDSQDYYHFDNFSITPEGSSLDILAIDIFLQSENYAEDILIFENSQTIILEPQTSFTYTLYFQDMNSHPYTDFVSAITDLIYIPSDNGNRTISFKIDFSIDEAMHYYNAKTNSFYFLQEKEEVISFEECLKEAEISQFYGEKGSLAAITSQEEMNFLLNNMYVPFDDCITAITNDNKIIAKNFHYYYETNGEYIVSGEKKGLQVAEEGNTLEGRFGYPVVLEEAGNYLIEFPCGDSNNNISTIAIKNILNVDISAEDEIFVSKEQDFLAIKNYLANGNSMAEKTIVLENDIIINDNNCIDLGTNEYPFDATINGKGRIITVNTDSPLFNYFGGSVLDTSFVLNGNSQMANEILENSNITNCIFLSENIFESGNCIYSNINNTNFNNVWIIRDSSRVIETVPASINAIYTENINLDYAISENSVIFYAFEARPYAIFNGYSDLEENPLDFGTIGNFDTKTLLLNNCNDNVVLAKSILSEPETIQIDIEIEGEGTVKIDDEDISTKQIEKYKYTKITAEEKWNTKFLYWLHNNKLYSIEKETSIWCEFPETYKAVFAPLDDRKDCLLSAEVTEGEGTIENNYAYYEDGENITINIIPEEGYKVYCANIITENGNEYIYDNEISFLITDNTMCKITLVPIQNNVFTVQYQKSSDIAGNVEMIYQENNYKKLSLLENENIYFFAEANENYSFVGWSKDDGNTIYNENNEISEIVEADITYVAIFVPNEPFVDTPAFEYTYSSDTIIYNGNLQHPSCETTASDENYQFITNSYFLQNGESVEPINAGIYDMYIVVFSSENVPLQMDYTHQFSIEKADRTAPEFTVRISNDFIICDNIVEGAIYRIKEGENAFGQWQNSSIFPVNEGNSYTIESKFPENQNYLESEITGQTAVVPSENTVLIFAENFQKIYDGKSTAIEFVASGEYLAEDVSIIYENDTYSSNTAPINAGNYTVSISLYGKITTKNYTISPMIIDEISYEDIIEKVYDGNKNIYLKNMEVNQVDTTKFVFPFIEGDDINIVFNEIKYENSLPGDKVIFISGLALEGEDRHNYQLSISKTVLNGTIKKAAICLADSGNIIVYDKEYDGTANVNFDADTSQLDFIGLIGDDIVLPEDIIIYYENSFAGQNKKIILDLSENLSSKYYFDIPMKADINKKSLEIHGIIAEDKVFDGTKKTELDFSSMILSGIVQDNILPMISEEIFYDMIKISYDSAEFASENAGYGHRITVQGLDIAIKEDIFDSDSPNFINELPSEYKKEIIAYINSFVLSASYYDELYGNIEKADIEIITENIIIMNGTDVIEIETNPTNLLITKLFYETYNLAIEGNEEDAIQFFNYNTGIYYIRVIYSGNINYNSKIKIINLTITDIKIDQTAQYINENGSNILLVNGRYTPEIEFSSGEDYELSCSEDGYITITGKTLVANNPTINPITITAWQQGTGVYNEFSINFDIIIIPGSISLEYGNVENFYGDMIDNSLISASYAETNLDIAILSEEEMLDLQNDIYFIEFSTNEELLGEYIFPLSIEVERRELTISLPEVSREYHETINYEELLSIDGFVNNEDIYCLQGSLETDDDIDYEVGMYELTFGGFSSNNYLINYIPALLVVEQKEITIKPQITTKYYGQTIPYIFREIEGISNQNDIEYLTGLTDITVQADRYSPVGIYPLYVSLNNYDENYNINLSNSYFYIEKAPITITAQDQNYIYGNIDIQLNYDISGVFLSEEIPLIDDIVSIFCNVEEDSDVGQYDIEINLLSTLENYDITVINGKATVKPASISGLEFFDMRVLYNGDTNTILINGDIEGFTIVYRNNTGTEIGIYRATATISKENYLDTILYAKLIITTNELQTTEAIPKCKIKLDEGGLDPDVLLMYENNTDAGILAIANTALDNTKGKSEIINSIINLSLVQDDQNINLSTNSEIKILIPESINNIESMRFVKISNGIAFDIPFVVDGNYLVINTDELGTYAFIASSITVLNEKAAELLVYTIAGIVGLIILIVLLNIFKRDLKQHRKKIRRHNRQQKR